MSTISTTIAPATTDGTIAMVAAPPRSYRLPDLIAMLPWKAEFNPHHDAVAKAAPEWAMSYAEEVAMSKERRAHFERGFSERLACWVYPYASPDKLRVCCDLFNLLWVLDEHCDEQSREGAQRVADTVLRTLADPSYDDGSVICRMTADVRDRLLPYMGPAGTRRFLEDFDNYIKATAEEATLREYDVLLTIPTFTALRRENSAVRQCLEVVGFILDIDLPDVVYEHPVFKEMLLSAIDLVTFPNDLYSYNREQAMGHKNCNALTVVMQSSNVSVQEAADHIGAHVKSLINGFEANKARLPSYGPEVDAIVQKYIMGMECWITGNIHWSFDMGRYFGRDHDKMRSTLLVDLLPAYAAK